MTWKQIKKSAVLGIMTGSTLAFGIAYLILKTVYDTTLH